MRATRTNPAVGRSRFIFAVSSPDRILSDTFNLIMYTPTPKIVAASLGCERIAVPRCAAARTLRRGLRSGGGRGGNVRVNGVEHGGLIKVASKDAIAESSFQQDESELSIGNFFVDAHEL